MDIKIHRNKYCVWVYSKKDAASKTPKNLFYEFDPSGDIIVKDFAMLYHYIKAHKYPEITLEELPILLQGEIVKDFPELAAPDELDEFVKRYQMT